MIIFDDVTDETKHAVEKFKNSFLKFNVKVLATTWNQTFFDETNLVAVNGFTEDEAIEFLKRKNELTAEEVEEIRQHVVVDSVVSTGEVKEEGGKKFIRMADKFVNIEDLNIDLIDSVNPFQKAFEILSKSVTTNVLKLIQESIESTRIQMDFEEAKILWPKVNVFVKEKGRHPELDASDLMERRLAECLVWIKQKQREKAEA